MTEASGEPQLEIGEDCDGCLLVAGTLPALPARGGLLALRRVGADGWLTSSGHWSAPGPQWFPFARDLGADGRVRLEVRAPAMLALFAALPAESISVRLHFAATAERDLVELDMELRRPSVTDGNEADAPTVDDAPLGEGEDEGEVADPGPGPEADPRQGESRPTASATGNGRSATPVPPPTLDTQPEDRARDAGIGALGDSRATPPAGQGDGLPKPRSDADETGSACAAPQVPIAAPAAAARTDIAASSMHAGLPAEPADPPSRSASEVPAPAPAASPADDHPPQPRDPSSHAVPAAGADAPATPAAIAHPAREAPDTELTSRATNPAAPADGGASIRPTGLHAAPSEKRHGGQRVGILLATLLIPIAIGLAWWFWPDDMGDMKLDPVEPPGTPGAELPAHQVLVTDPPAGPSSAAHPDPETPGEEPPVAERPLAEPPVEPPPADAPQARPSFPHGDQPPAPGAPTPANGSAAPDAQVAREKLQRFFESAAPAPVDCRRTPQDSNCPLSEDGTEPLDADAARQRLKDFFP
jgi:hypothetical protein